MDKRKDQAPVVQTLDRAIHWINHYPLDNSIGFASVYPLDSDLSGGQRYPSFEQLGPGPLARDQTRQESAVSMVCRKTWGFLNSFTELKIRTSFYPIRSEIVYITK